MRISDWSSDVCSSDLAACKSPSGIFMTRQVYLADRPQSFSVEDNETLLAAGLRHGLALPFGCQSGGCGSCRVPLIRGEIDYLFAPPALSVGAVGKGRGRERGRECGGESGGAE